MVIVPSLQIAPPLPSTEEETFLLFSIIEGAEDNAYPHQTNLHEHSVRSIDEWKREQAKGHGMDWER